MHTTSSCECLRRRAAQWIGLRAQLPYVELAYNFTPNEVTGFSPYRLALGHEAPSPLDSLFTGRGEESDDVGREYQVEPDLATPRPTARGAVLVHTQEWMSEVETTVRFLGGTVKAMRTRGESSDIA